MIRCHACSREHHVLAGDIPPNGNWLRCACGEKLFVDRYMRELAAYAKAHRSWEVASSRWCDAREAFDRDLQLWEAVYGEMFRRNCRLRTLFLLIGLWWLIVSSVVAINLLSQCGPGDASCTAVDAVGAELLLVETVVVAAGAPLLYESLRRHRRARRVQPPRWSWGPPPDEPCPPMTEAELAVDAAERAEEAAADARRSAERAEFATAEAAAKEAAEARRNAWQAEQMRRAAGAHHTEQMNQQARKN